MSESSFFQDLAVLMTAAGVVSVVCARFSLPKLMGYILAGVLMSRHTWGGGFLTDEQSVTTIGQLGVVFLMFTMGLGFSTSQLKKIRAVAAPVAIVDTVVMTWLGYTVATAGLGWGPVAALFLGAAICDSATTMLAKVIDEMKWGGRPFVKYALGSSVCEDIICVGIIAVITGVAKGGGMSLGSAAFSLGGLGIFFLAVIVSGFVLVPRLLVSVAKKHDDEALFLAMLGCCFFVSWVAFRFEFSLAIGAFLVGIIGAASEARYKLEAMADPLKSMFAAVFFVSIGLLLNPSVCWAHAPEILLLAALVIVGKFVNCTVVALLAGERVRTAVQMGMSLAQIGEFAFMVAVLYKTTTGDSTSPIYDIVVAVSLLTTMVNPLMIRWSGPVGEWIEARLPRRAALRLEMYQAFMATIRAPSRASVSHRLVRACCLNLVIIAALNLAVGVACTILDARDWSNFSSFFEANKRFFFCLAANLFVVALATPAFRSARHIGRLSARLLVGGEPGPFPQTVRGLVRMAVLVVAGMLYLLEMTLINVNLAPEDPVARWSIKGLLLLAAVFGWRFFTKATRRAETRFGEAMGAEERREKIGRMLTFTVPEGAIHRLTLEAASPAVGSTVVTLNVRAKTGASIVAVERGAEIIRNVGPEVEFRVGDTLVAVGEGHQIAALKDLLGIIVNPE